MVTLPYGWSRDRRDSHVTIGMMTIFFGDKKAEPVVIDSMSSSERRALTKTSAVELDGVKAARRSAAVS